MLEQLSEEIWKDIPNYEGFYQASTWGRIKGLARWSDTSRNGVPYKRFLTEKIIKIVYRKGKRELYGHVSLCKNAIIESCSVSVLILETFVGPRPEGMQACHYPSQDCKNNRLDNLLWATPSENNMHKHEQGSAQIGTRNGNHVYTEDEIKRIRELRSKGLKLREIANIFDTSEGYIGNVINRRLWKHV